jgi:hypothetical protein
MNPTHPELLDLDEYEPCDVHHDVPMNPLVEMCQSAGGEEGRGEFGHSACPLKDPGNSQRGIHCVYTMVALSSPLQKQLLQYEVGCGYYPGLH